MRSQSLVGRLARLGFADATAAAAALEPWHTDDPADLDRLVDALARTADPDQALSGLGRFADGQPELWERVRRDADQLGRLASVLGMSAALPPLFAQHPEAVAALAETPRRTEAATLRRRLLEAVDADPDLSRPRGRKDAADELRLAYRTEVARIAARDLAAPDPLAVMDDIAGELADLADAVVEAALAVARDEVGDAASETRLGVVAMGKCGAQELNYVSDVDVVFVTDDESSVATATRLASAMTRVCSAHTAAGTIWQVDAALRPEGKAGPLVRTMASMEAYYSSWAKAWEFQAMLKARPMAGDLDLAGELVKLVSPHVWRVAERDGFVNDTQAMRRRVISLIPAREQGRELKLGEGGLRDVEFTVQLLQLVHGRNDDRVRARATLPALQALVDHGYVGRADGAELEEAYRFIRVLEHRAQLHRMRRTHLLPDHDDDLRRIGRTLGTDAREVVSGWRRRSRRVLALHRRMFYSPLLETVARIPSGQVALTTEAAQQRLKALGYLDPGGALRHIEALSQGVSRQAEIQRQLLPAMLGWFAEAPNPDHGLLAFRQVSEALGNTPWYLRALRDEGAMAERLATLLASSRFLVDLLRRDPTTVQLLADTDDLAPRDRDAIAAAMRKVAHQCDTPEAAIDAVRAIRRRELFRVGVGDLLGVTALDAVGRGLSAVAGATLDVALEIAARDADPGPLAVIAMGRWGGGELGYGSDADAMFVLADDSEESRSRGTALVTRLRTLLSRPGPEPRLEIDADLRPEGRNGPLVRSLQSYANYYERWSATWEAQALVRADLGAGDRATGERLLALIDVRRWPEGGLTAGQLTEIRRLKARMEAERMPRGTDPKRHLKLGPGGLSDVEWTVQLLQLEHAHAVEALRTPSTLEALAALEEADLMSAQDVSTLRHTWELASMLRNRIMLVRGKASDQLPVDARELAAVAQLTGRGPGAGSHLVEEWHRAARQSRAVMNRLFWGETD
ncbi:bifunctional [glutamine synthetase] adenylyltransferase/[glutamine synthetase]-adenylyl-L-tyrosine phosphorylase [Mariniluteicoccus endophyticus]